LFTVAAVAAAAAAAAAAAVCSYPQEIVKQMLQRN
jgi:hypothetical protein